MKTKQSGLYRLVTGNMVRLPKGVRIPQGAVKVPTPRVAGGRTRSTGYSIHTAMGSGVKRKA
jgi:hypothetical protein